MLKLSDALSGPASALQFTLTRDPLTAQRRVQRAEMVGAFLVSDEYRHRFGP